MVLARVNEEIITWEDLRGRFQARHMGLPIPLAGEEDVRRYLDNYIDERLLTQEAYRMGLDREEDVIKRVKAFRLARLREELYQEEVVKKVDVSQEELKAHYDSLPGEKPEFSSVEPRLRRQFLRQKQEARAKDFLDSLRASARIEIKEGLLPRVLEGSPPEGEDVLARFDQGEITLHDFRQLLNLEALLKIPRETALGKVKEVLDELISNRLLEREALRRGLDSGPSFLEAVKGFEERLIRDKLYLEVILKKVRVSDGEVEAYYRDHQGEFTEPERVRLSQILLKTEGETRDALASLQAGKDFATLAKEKSQDPSTAQKGGDMGWVRLGILPPELEEVAFSLYEGDISNPIKAKDGYYIIQVRERRKATVRPFEEVKGYIKEKLVRERQQEAMKSWIKKLRERSVIEINEDALKEALGPK